MNGHLDKLLKWDKMAREKQLNVTMNTKAEEAHEKSIENKE